MVPAFPPKYDYRLRSATPADIPALNDMISLSVRTLHKPFYSDDIIDSAMKYVYGADTQLISDETYFLIEAFPSQSSDLESAMVAAGGWSFRSTLYGGDQFSDRDPAPLNPEIDAAKLRAMFVHPSFTRQGLANLMLAKCEGEAKKKGFKRLEFGATYAGIPFYEKAGYVRLKEVGEGGEGRCDKVMKDGRRLELAKMGKSFE
ncbi:uncharacterized protein PAC_07503 [Phialocephala subalpina]|uniref:N-acetyltransferase domain-containing protein n=1 Tax=Phialocephala subalpina TaxID=576137 RepID=A0A1L7WXX5_9HELO|nr:uncharacterized protein PAC_07503 [Phialocephala subalpina]